MEIPALEALIISYKYIVIFVAAPFVGPLVTLASGALARVEVVGLLPAALTLMASELSADILWYVLGLRFGDGFVRRFGPYVGITRARVEIVRRAYHQYHDSIILTSKLTAGFGIAPVIFFTAGLTRIPFRRYMLMNVLGQVIWTPVIIGVGYYLSDEYLGIGDVFGKIAFVATALVLCAALVLFARETGKRLLGSPHV